MKLSEKQKSNFSIYCIILISILTSPLFIINSSNKIKRRGKTNFQNNEFEPKIKSLRNLDFNTDSSEVCSRSSKDLINYFETGDVNYVKLYEDIEDKEPSDITIYIINILSDEGDFTQNIKNYMKHLAPLIILFILGVLCIPGWLVFCCCAFCSCSCFNVCKAIKCRIPFFILLLIINLIFIVNSIVGLIKIDPIIKGLSNAECSLLRFINEVLEGETKNSLPKWGGVSKIVNIFDRTIENIEIISRDNTLSVTQEKSNLYQNRKNYFIHYLESVCNTISYNYRYKELYLFDMAYYFGSYTSDGTFSKNSYAEKWYKEAEITYDVENSVAPLKNIIISHAHETLDEARNIIKDMGIGFEQLKDNIGEKIIDYSEKINLAGKITLILLFSVLLIISLLSEIIFIYLLVVSCRKNNYQNISRCLKFLINLFWNIMAILVIVIFILSGFIFIIGRIGEDFFEAFSFLFSSRNLLSPSPRIFGDSAPYLDICINGDGNIAKDLRIENDLKNIDSLKTKTENIDKIIKSITNKVENPDSDRVYDEIISELDKRINNNIEYGFINTQASENITLYATLKKLKEKLSSCNINDIWNFTCRVDNQGACDSAINTSKCINPKSCQDELIQRYKTICNSDNIINDINQILATMDFANSEDEDNSIKMQALNVKNAYRNFLSNAKYALDGFTRKFQPFSNIYNDIIGSGSIESVINCTFIGNNVKILLHYLNDTIGKGFSTLGITLVIDGIIMLFCISFTILLLSIFDELSRISSIETEENNKINYVDNPLKVYKDNPIPSSELSINAKK